MYRQGDVLLLPAALPADVKIDAPEEIVLALGEATGHRHRFAGGTRSGVRSYRKGTDRYVEVRSRGRKLVHEEHSSIEVAPGTYEVVIQSEYSEEEIRTVMD